MVWSPSGLLILPEKSLQDVLRRLKVEDVLKKVIKASIADEDV